MKALKNSDIKKQYASYPSLADHLPWLEWSDSENILLLEDLRSCGMLLEVRDIATEAKPEALIAEIHHKIKTIFSTVVPLEDESPWVMQIFIQDDLTLDPLYRKLKAYVKDPEDAFTKQYLKTMRKHFKLMCREEGIFNDPMSGIVFRGRTRRIRLAVYRRYDNPKAITKRITPVNELKEVIKTIISRLRQMGLSVRILKGRHFYEWLVRWFNPQPEIVNDTDALLQQFPYPGTKKPFGWSFSQNVFFNTVSSDNKAACWHFDGLKHKVLVFNDSHQESFDIGVISRERNFGGGKNKYALLDKFPAGSIYTIQVIFESKKKVLNHLENLEKAAIGNATIVQEIIGNIKRARIEIENGNMLFRSCEAIFIRADTTEALHENERNLRSLLADSGLVTVKSDAEIHPLDTYLRFLPFNLSYQFDKTKTFRSSYKYADDVARLLPIYGRSKGDGLHPLFVFFNRGGEAFIFDHLHKRFKQANSHMAIVGTTGAGKSVFLNAMILGLAAVHQARIFALEVGGSFDLTSLYLHYHGRKVNRLKFERQNPIIVNPYAEWQEALRFVEAEETILKQLAIQDAANFGREAQILEHGIEEEVVASTSTRLEKELEGATCDASETELKASEDRDILQEMLLATRTMITGGVEEEEARITRSDDMLITRGLIYTMKRCKAAQAKGQIKQMLVQHVHESFILMAQEESNSELAKRLGEFALNIENYLKGMRAHFINGESKPLEDADLTHIDFGFLQSADYKDLLNVVCISLLAKILALAEKNKTSGRPTILIIDEAHVFFKSKMVAAFLILMSKVARKINLWLIPCTQNIQDFAGIDSRKVLSMMETWLCLSLDREEIKMVEQFKPLSDEMRALVFDVQKYPGIYAEGVLIGKNYSGLFRNVPPRLNLALAMTDPDERSERHRIKTENNLSELEAVQYMAEQMETRQNQSLNEDEDFYE